VGPGGGVTTVVDLGCADHGSSFSLGALLEEFAPSRIFGFDPWPDLNESIVSLDGVPTTLRRSAAWLFDGEVSYRPDGTGSRIGEGDSTVACFDFSAWLRRTVNGGRTVVKMDVEGSEYALLDRMISDGTDLLVSELLVEWHGDESARRPILARLRCPVRAWLM
jgi:hypothetical protein